MTWKQLVAANRIKPHRTSKAELDELREAVEVKLRDAASTAISADTRFATAYGAALLVAKMVLACSGYRLDSKGGGHHVTAFEALPLAIGAAVEPYRRYFDLCRRKRNEIDYDRAFVVSDTDAEEIVRETLELRRIAENWIWRHHRPFSK